MPTRPQGYHMRILFKFLVHARVDLFVFPPFKYLKLQRRHTNLQCVPDDN